MYVLRAAGFGLVCWKMCMGRCLLHDLCSLSWAGKPFGRSSDHLALRDLSPGNDIASGIDAPDWTPVLCMPWGGQERCKTCRSRIFQFKAQAASSQNGPPCLNVLRLYCLPRMWQVSGPECHIGLALLIPAVESVPLE